MDGPIAGMLLGTGAVWAIAIVALWLTVSRPIPALPPSKRDQLLRPFALAISLQCLHFLEEFLTGFHLRFPPLLGFQGLTERQWSLSSRREATVNRRIESCPYDMAAGHDPTDPDSGNGASMHAAC